jgi:methyl coenzyme M reductase subunit C
MNVEIISIEPGHFRLGKTPCTIKYQVKSDNTGQGSVTIRMAGSDLISFFLNNGNTKSIGPETKSFVTQYTIFEKLIQIELTDASSELAPRARIRIDATDSVGDTSNSTQTISHE